mgnify:CR=1 FL=1
MDVVLHCTTRLVATVETGMETPTISMHAGLSTGFTPPLPQARRQARVLQLGVGAA